RIAGGVLRVLSGPDQGRTCALAETPVVVGTGSACQLQLRDRTNSRRHCEIACGMQGFLVRDLGSHHGSFFDCSKIFQLAVPPGALLRLGDTVMFLGVASDSPLLELSPRTRFGDLLGASAPMRRLFALLERAAACDATVLLLGETGTGKDLAAQMIHREGV